MLTGLAVEGVKYIVKVLKRNFCFVQELISLVKVCNGLF